MATCAKGIGSPCCHQSTCEGGSCQEQSELILWFVKYRNVRVWIKVIQIKRASVNEAGLVAKLAIQMWDDNSVDGLEVDFINYMNNGGAVFMAWNDNTAIGFAQCGFRHDYVEGTETSPVGYLEGVFVEAAYRRQGIARELVKACQIFAKEQGCTEFASDCELDNVESLQFHLKMGFEEANRIICFTMKL